VTGSGREVALDPQLRSVADQIEIPDLTDIVGARAADAALTASVQASPKFPLVSAD
jgi:hypothetical protein